MSAKLTKSNMNQLGDFLETRPMILKDVLAAIVLIKMQVPEFDYENLDNLETDQCSYDFYLSAKKKTK
jgi:DNA polymerase III psi subunit